jgi:hypothetical protein
MNNVILADTNKGLIIEPQNSIIKEKVSPVTADFGKFLLVSGDLLNLKQIDQMQERSLQHTPSM